MKQLILGALFGSMITSTIVGADSFYDSNGQPAAPRGSVQQFDYFRQQQLEIKYMREQQDRVALERKLGKRPC
jgi:hypothetical protein